MRKVGGGQERGQILTGSPAGSSLYTLSIISFPLSLGNDANRILGYRMAVLHVKSAAIKELSLVEIKVSEPEICFQCSPC